MLYQVFCFVIVLLLINVCAASSKGEKGYTSTLTGRRKPQKSASTVHQAAMFGEP